VGDPFGHVIGGASNHHAARAVADEDDVAQVLVFDDVGDVADMYFKSDFRPRQVRALAEPGQRRSEHLVPLRTQQRRELFPAPAAEPSRMDQYIGHLVAIPRPRIRGI